ncbi:hypothetical protein [Motilimonas eburnea]|uniref:hypothetical protein n=1 Tax=Motilimonas eburnea TaxID=1737488 RepID=UPI001E411D07|nr:hypothetical protein [Motilimonas eburnea]MCE2572721.1 hypothetical protein [Motilimonas eburnea]
MKQGCIQQWARFLVISVLLKLMLPFYASAASVVNPALQGFDPNEKILICTAAGFKWVKASELFADAKTSHDGNQVVDVSGFDGHGNSPFSKFKCALCVPCVDLGSLQQVYLGIKPSLLLSQLTAIWYQANGLDDADAIWFQPLLRAPPQQV